MPIAIRSKYGPFLSIAVLGLFICQPAAYGRGLYLGMEIGETDLVPAPRIIAPATNIVDLRACDRLEFRWSPYEGDATKRDHYDFRLYKGPQAFEAGRIFKTRAGPRQWSLALSSDFFQPNTLYTITLRQVYTGSVRSRRSIMTFSVIK